MAGQKGELGGALGRRNGRNAGSAKRVKPEGYKRLTLDLDPTRHDTLRRAAFESDVHSTEIIRSLIDLFGEDAKLAERTLAAVRQERLASGR